MSRLVDRPLRPLFPKGMRNEVQVIITAMSTDGQNLMDPLAIIAGFGGAGHQRHPLERPDCRHDHRLCRRRVRREPHGRPDGAQQPEPGGGRYRRQHPHGRGRRPRTARRSRCSRRCVWPMRPTARSSPRSIEMVAALGKAKAEAPRSSCRRPRFRKKVNGLVQDKIAAIAGTGSGQGRTECRARRHQGRGHRGFCRARRRRRSDRRRSGRRLRGHAQEGHAQAHPGQGHAPRRPWHDRRFAPSACRSAICRACTAPASSCAARRMC